MAGFEAERGVLSLPLVVLAGTVGSILGGTAWYGVGRALGLERLSRWAARGGRWLTLSPEEVVRSEKWFARWGLTAVCIGRALPDVREVIRIPGRDCQDALLDVSALVLARRSSVDDNADGAGYVLAKRYTQVEQWLNPVTDLFMAPASRFMPYVCSDTAPNAKGAWGRENQLRKFHDLCRVRAWSAIEPCRRERGAFSPCLWATHRNGATATIWPRGRP